MSDAMGELPVAMSLESAQSLLGQGLLDAPMIERTLILRAEERLPAGAHLYVRGFRVPHCPGSIGIEITDGQALLIYTGDVCFDSARHSVISELVRRLQRSRVDRKTVIVDATMAGRADGASRSHPAGELLAQPTSDLLLISTDASQLMYGYLDLFSRIWEDRSRRHQYAFILTKRARPLFELVHAAFISTG